MNEIMILEEWRWLSPFHEVSDMGRVRSYKKRGGGRLFKPRQLKIYRDKNNPYPRVYIGGKIFPIHVLVCFAWHGPRPEGAECVRHLDGDPRNNVPSNLQWGTHKENAQDTIRHGRHIGVQYRNLKAENEELRKRVLDLTAV